jgi:hypothetical protein
MSLTGTPGDGLCHVCGHRIPPGWLMCHPHWRLVPPALQNAVWAALRAYENGAGFLETLRAAQEKAVDACSEAIHA